MAENQFTHTENEIFDWRVSPSDYGIDVSTYRIGGFAEKKTHFPLDDRQAAVASNTTKWEKKWKEWMVYCNLIKTKNKNHNKDKFVEFLFFNKKIAMIS